MIVEEPVFLLDKDFLQSPRDFARSRLKPPHAVFSEKGMQKPAVPVLYDQRVRFQGRKRKDRIEREERKNGGDQGKEKNGGDCSEPSHLNLTRLRKEGAVLVTTAPNLTQGVRKVNLLREAGHGNEKLLLVLLLRRRSGVGLSSTWVFYRPNRGMQPSKEQVSFVLRGRFLLQVCVYQPIRPRIAVI